MVSQAVVVIFVLLLTLSLNYFLIAQFGFSKDHTPLIILGLLCFGLLVYFLLSKPLLEPLFKSDNNLQKALKETLHELNIPVSTIKLNAKMLEKNIHDEKSLKRLSRIEQASNNLLSLYEQMEYSIKKEIDTVESVEFDFAEAMDESLKKFEDLKKDIKINLDIENKVLNSDRNGFIKVLDNLISNAIKYNTKEGFINIVFKDELLSIENSGKTIDTKNLFMVFDRYYQENQDNNGFGLGLNIVKEYCDKYLINIKIEPKETGTIFYLNLSKIVQ